MSTATEPSPNILNSMSIELKARPTTSTAVLSKGKRQSITSDHFRSHDQHFLSQLFSPNSSSSRLSRSSQDTRVGHSQNIRRVFNAYIVTSDTIRTKDLKYVVYKILVTSGLSQWFVHKRFSEFLELHKHLQKRFPNLAKQLPKLPSKRIFFGKFLASHISSRKDRINKYLSALIEIPVFRNFEDVRRFFAEDISAEKPNQKATLTGSTAVQLLNQVASVSDDPFDLPNLVADSSDTISLGDSPFMECSTYTSNLSTSPNLPHKTFHIFKGNPKNGIPVSTRRPVVLKRAATSSLLELSPNATPRTSFAKDRTRSRASSIASPKASTFPSSRVSDKPQFKRPQKPKHPCNRATLDDFVLLKVIGSGSYGKVMLARHKSSGLVLAIKAISKKQLLHQPKEIARVISERSVLKRTLDHPFLVSLRYSFQTPKKLYFCIDYVNGGELFYHIQREKRFSEERTKFYATEILLALEYLHSKRIIYRDLKPENCLIDSAGHIRIVDFGMAKDMAQIAGGRLYSMCGTPEYMAPEVLKEEGYDMTLDWYCLGAVIYEMLVGSPPYYSREQSDMFDKILHSRLKFPSFVSPVARDIISRLLERDPSKRLGAGLFGSRDIRDHAFFEGVYWDDVLAKAVDPPFTPTVTGLLDMRNIDPSFHQQPLPNSIENEGKVSIIPTYGGEKLQEDVMNMFGGVRNPDDIPSDGPDYNQHFFASGSRFELSQSRFCTLEGDSFTSRSSDNDVSNSPNPNTPVIADEVEDLTKAFEGFSYVCAEMENYLS